MLLFISDDGQCGSAVSNVTW